MLESWCPVLSETDREKTKDIFGADDVQVERDHLVSHALAAISADLGERVKFYGGTALARTFIPQGRLSEDIDLISVGPRIEIAEALTRTLTRRLSREFGRPAFQPALADSRGAQSVAVTFPSGQKIKIQLQPSDHYPDWPFEFRDLIQRYDDVAPATLLVPTLDTFIAWKTVAFIDRRASRDLWDLAALAQLGPFRRTSAELFTSFGQFRSLPTASTIPQAPTESVWHRDLAHQTRLLMTAVDARATVVNAWADLGRHNQTR